jgi:hypothetical protein
MIFKRNFSDGVFYFSMENIKENFKSNIFTALKATFPEFKNQEE